MVRLIQIIKKNLRKTPAVPESVPAAAAPAVGPAPAQPRQFPAENPYRRKTFGTSESSAAPAKSSAELKALYRELYGAAQFALSGALHREKIEQVLRRVVDAFAADPYNELLLIAFSFSRKNYLPAHIANDVILVTGFARSLGFSTEDACDIALCAFTHDLGMAGFEAIAKKGQQLSSEEIEDIKNHPSRSAELVRPVFSEKIASVVMDIHERENGQGYPRGIPGTRIHVWAKIISLCDAFEALTHPRVFRPAYSPYEAIKIIIKKKDILFDDAVVKRFIDFMSIYPVGSLVVLNSGETAMVLGATLGTPTRPVVRILVNERREIEEGERTIDLAAKDFVYIAGALDPEKEQEILHFLKPRGQVELDEA